MWVGIQQMEYGSLAAAHMPAMGAFTATGTPFSVAAGRISFTYGFKGPAVRTSHCRKKLPREMHVKIMQTLAAKLGWRPGIQMFTHC